MTPLNAVAVLPEKEVSTYLEQAKSFTIKTREDFALVDAHCKAGLELKKKIQADFKDSKAAAKAAHQAICDQEAAHLEGIDEGRYIDKKAMDAFLALEKAEADKAAELARAVEKKRLEDEALARAARAAEFGDDKGADEIISAPIVTAPAAAYQAPKSATVFRTVWRARVVDPMKVPREYLMVNEKALKDLAANTKGSISIPGVEIYSERV